MTLQIWHLVHLSNCAGLTNDTSLKVLLMEEILHLLGLVVYPI